MSAESRAAGRAGVIARLPNAISIARLVGTVVLVLAAAAGRRALFTWLLVACLVSDIADGWIARRFRVTSRTGAFLDSTADIATTIVAVAGIVVFERGFVSSHAVPLLLVAGLYLAEVIAAFWRYGRISSFHTYMSRAAAYVQGAFIVSLLLWGDVSWLFAVAMALSIAAYLEEIVLVMTLPRWTADVGGLYRVWRRRRMPQP